MNIKAWWEDSGLVANEEENHPLAGVHPSKEAIETFANSLGLKVKVQVEGYEQKQESSCNCGWGLPPSMCQNPDKTYCG